MRAPTREAFLRRHRPFSLHTSMAGRLLVGGLAFTVVLTGGVGGFLVVSRSEQTDSGALSNADNRAGIAGQLIARVTGPQAQYAATDLAALSSFQSALASPTPAASVAKEFTDRRIVSVSGVDVVVVGPAGDILYTTECDAPTASGVLHPTTAQCEGANPHVTGGLSSVRAALSELAAPACRAGASLQAGGTACPSWVEGVENLAPDVPAFDVAVPVFDQAAHTNTGLGVVVYSAPLQTLLKNYGPVIGYTPLFISAGAHPTLLRFVGQSDTPVTVPVPNAVLSQVSPHTTTSSTDTFVAHAIYPLAGAGEVAGSFVPLEAPGSKQVSGYLGVEVPLSLFAARAAQDEQTIAQISLTALLVLCLLVLFFVDRFVRRPVNRLERGVARIAAGDYTTDIPVGRQDELGRLAASVNRMREQIAGYIRHIDGSMDRLQRISRALTTTTGGVERLQDAVLDSASTIAGGAVSATLFTRVDGNLVVARTLSETTFLGRPAVESLLGGRHLRVDEMDSHLVAVPMFYQEAVIGAVALTATRALSDSDERALMTLANNAAVALENTRLFEQQKETVERLSELNSLKSNFLATTQHELRTPVLAIQGQLDLLSAGWSRWDEETKRDILRDIGISTKLLAEVVATIVDFSLLSSDRVDLQIADVGVRTALDAAVRDVESHFKDGLPVVLLTDVAPGLVVRADPGRFQQVLRSLIDNAVKFTPSGGHVLVQGRADLSGNRCRLEVSDDGIGIAPEALPLVFDRFFQEDNTRTRKYGGMGMGLALVRRLCEAHGATVSVQSEPGRGSRFTVLWPLGASDQRFSFATDPTQRVAL